MKIIIGIGRFFLNIIYSIECLVDTDKTVLFMSRQSNEPSMDFNMLAECIREKHPDYKIKMLCKRMRDDVDNKYLYAFHIFTQMKAMSRARVVIIDSACFPVSLLKHRKNQTIVQIWHSIGTMKKNSYSILDEPEGRSSTIAKAMKMHENYDVILCAGEGYKGYLAESFNYSPDKLTVLPLPRVDVLKDEAYRKQKRETLITNHPELGTAKNILYVPTFRKDVDEIEASKKAVSELRQAIKSYDKKYNLIIKAHPLSEIPSDYPEYSSMDMMTVADCVVSDYSCVIYEAGLMNIPLYFYTYDYKEYMSRRSVYMDYPNEIPGKMHTAADELMKDIDSGKYNYDRLKSFVDKYVEPYEGSATENIVDYIWSKIGK